MNVEQRARMLIAVVGIGAAAAGGACLQLGIQDAPYRTHPLVTHMKELNRAAIDFRTPKQEREAAQKEFHRLYSLRPVEDAYLGGTETKINIGVGALLIAAGLAAAAFNKQVMYHL